MREEILKAKEEMKKVMQSPNMFMELASKVFGQPVDPLRPYPKLVEMVADVDTTEVGEDVYKFDVNEDTKEVYYIDTNSTVTSSKVTPDSVASVSFTDALTKEYYVTFTDLLAAKYDVIARKKVTIARALDAVEIKRTVLVLDAAIAVGSRVVLGSSETKFKYTHLISMREKIKDYGDNFVLIVGSQIDEDIIRWDYDENKYQSLQAALADLKISIVRVVGSVTIGGVAKSILATNKAILVALNTELAGKPVKFSRRMLNPIEILGGDIDGAMQRATIVTPAIMPVGSNRIPSVGVVGFESLAVVNVNSKAQSGFYRGAAWVSES